MLKKQAYVKVKMWTCPVWLKKNPSMTVKNTQQPLTMLLVPDDGGHLLLQCTCDASHSVWKLFLTGSVSVSVAEPSGYNTREVVS